MLIVTIAALVMAASLGWFAFRLLQEEQRRSEARVALLTAALEDEVPARVEMPIARQATPSRFFEPAVTQPQAASGTAAHTPAIVMLEDDSRRMGTFRSEYDETDTARDDEAGRAHTTTPADAPLRTAFAADAEADGASDRETSRLFAEVPTARPADARGFVAVAGIVLVGLLAVGYAWFGGSAAPADTTPAPAAGTVVAKDVAAGTASASAAPRNGRSAAPAGIPLELLSLAHEQRGQTLVVRGLVRNPVSGSDRAGVVASVMLLDQAGGFLGSGRAPIDASRLQPGDDVGFQVRVPSHKDVRRYRVTFRSADGALVPHADKRSRP